MRTSASVGGGYALGVFTARFLRARQDDVWRRDGCRSAGQPKPPALVLNQPSCYPFRVLDPPPGYRCDVARHRRQRPEDIRDTNIDRLRVVDASRIEREAA